MQQGVKRGLLNNDFKLFHLRDKNDIQFEHHYHDFNKIIVFIYGEVIYNIEGRSYKLMPWDILLVPRDQVHRPVIGPEEEYERIVIWINDAFLKRHGNEDNDLLACFRLARENRHLLRLGESSINAIRTILAKVELETDNIQFGAGILCNALFVEFIVYVNRLYTRPDEQAENIEVMFDEFIQRVISYINSNLGCDLSIDALSKRFFINKYYLMHKFKASTGCSLHSYISNKRIQKCAAYIKEGLSPAEAASRCGFNDYSNFARTFSKMLGFPPGKYCKENAARKGKDIHRDEG
ncbi:AraC-like DNA-binding protein [Ruminiclostridium sufflavum DSM 19573]|uniref:AraC-like DNA-binding protein n=1 Tax=Ruminiclostridium sufflavum DSM 19573 TaxID=1121337 RepID=A0A318XPX8_9FIRM|nr:AraC family transcriptional regulator [Ruminiclostridium sufflavum]PYG87815.1 AraC-like DNA-binding protein [Ruminiclostridium sufflavum DSM 19573]